MISPLSARLLLNCITNNFLKKPIELLFSAPNFKTASFLISFKVKTSSTSGFLVGQRISDCSHLLFADDTVIFCDAEAQQLRFLRCILLCFELCSYVF